MAQHGWSTDRVLGFGGVSIAVIVMALGIAAAANPDAGEWLPTTASAAGYLGLAALVGLTIRHWKVHPHGEGRQRIVGAWTLLGMVLGWVLLISDQLPAPGELDDGLALMIPIPLAVAALGTLRDGKGRPDYTVAPPPAASGA